MLTDGIAHQKAERHAYPTRPSSLCCRRAITRSTDFATSKQGNLLLPPRQGDREGQHFLLAKGSRSQSYATIPPSAESTNVLKLKLRLRTLLDKKRALQSRATPASKLSSSYVTLDEGFRLFSNDLDKLQQFVEVNQTAFSKILKKVLSYSAVRLLLLR